MTGKSYGTNFGNVEDLRFLVVGLGSIGRRHIHNLKAINPGFRVAVWRKKHPGEDLGDVSPLIDQVVTSLDEALAFHPDAALVTNPAHLHVETGLELAQKGVHLFIEKPLSNTMEGVDSLLDLCRSSGVVLMVGYNFRFYEPLRRMKQAIAGGSIGRIMALRAEVGQYLPEWRPGVDYRRSVSARQDLGGGAVLELSHEFDYARWLAGEVESVSAQIGRLSDLEIDVEDTAEIILKFTSGAIGSVHVDMVQRPTTRICRIVGTEGTLTWDWSQHQVKHFDNETGAWSDLHPAMDIDRNAMYVDELRHFISCVCSGATAEIGGDDARRVLEIALAVKQSSQEQRVLNIGNSLS